MKRIDEEKLSEMKVAAEITKRLEEDGDSIDFICDEIQGDITTKSAFIKHVKNETGITQAKI